MAKISKDEKNKNKIALLEYKVKGGKIILKKTKLGYMYYIRVYKPSAYNYASKDIPTDIYEGKENGKVAQLKEKLLFEIEELKKEIKSYKRTELDYINEYKKKLVIDYLKEYIDEKKDLRPITRATYHHYIDKLNTYFNKQKLVNLTLDDLCNEHIKKFYSHLRNDCNLKMVTLRKYRNILKPAFDKAYDDNYINNPIRHKLEKIGSSSGEKAKGDSFSKEELQTFFNEIKDHPLEQIFKITYFLGLRRSEVLGLRWSNIDFDSRKIYICGNVQKLNKKFLIEERMNKTEESNSYFICTNKLLNILLLVKERIQNNKNIFGNAYNRTYDDFVCVDPLGNLYNPNYLTKSFRKIVDKMNIKNKNLHFHSIRHTAGTILYQETKDIYKAMIFLRHTNVETTKLYLHPDNGDKSEMAKQVSEAVDF